MNIVILDGYTTNPGDLSWDFLRQFGEVTVYDRTKPAEIVARCKDAQIVVTNKTPLTKAEIDQMPNLQFVALLSTGYNVVDGAYLREKGIPLSNIPSYSTNAVAQLVFAFLTAFCNRVAQHSDAVRTGEWSACADFCFWKAPLSELSGKTLGIIGFGKIGQKVADIAEAFDMRILASSGHETDKPPQKLFVGDNRRDCRTGGFYHTALPVNPADARSGEPRFFGTLQENRVSHQHFPRTGRRRPSASRCAEQRAHCRRGARCAFGGAAKT